MARTLEAELVTTVQTLHEVTGTLPCNLATLPGDLVLLLCTLHTCLQLVTLVTTSLRR